MPATKLTAAFCNSVKPTGGKQMAYPDSDVRGLELRVSGDGRKTWTFRYRMRDGRQSRMSLGVYSPEFDLANARKEARKARVTVDGGGDPAGVQRAAKEAARNEPIQTFADLAAAYFSATERGAYRPKRPSSLTNEHAVYRVHIKPALAGLRLETVTKRTVKNALAAMLDKGVTSQAVRAQAVIRQMFAFAVFEERLDANPIRDLPPVAPARARARIYSDDELRAIWRGVSEPGLLTMPEPWATRWRTKGKVAVGPAMRIALKLAMLLLQRRGEILGMMESELDLKHGVWNIPAGRMKTKRPHAVPLSPAAIALVEEAIALNRGTKTSLVFPGRTDLSRPMSGPSMNHALACVTLALGIEDATIHDLRRTGSTLMTSERLGISPFIRSKILGHLDTGGGAAVSTIHYDANAYLAEKRRALEAWQALLNEIVSGGSEASSKDDVGREPAAA
jgi:integrase